MQRLPGRRSLCGMAVKEGKSLADPQFHVHVENCEKIIPLKFLHMLFLAHCDRCRAEVGAFKVIFQVRQDGPKMGEHASIRVVKGEGKGRLHSDWKVRHDPFLAVSSV